MLTEMPGGPAGMPSFTNLTLARIWEVLFIGLFALVLVLSYSQLSDLVPQKCLLIVLIAHSYGDLMFRLQKLS